MANNSVNCEYGGVYCWLVLLLLLLLLLWVLQEDQEQDPDHNNWIDRLWSRKRIEPKIHYEVLLVHEFVIHIRPGDGTQGQPDKDGIVQRFDRPRIKSW